MKEYGDNLLTSALANLAGLSYEGNWSILDDTLILTTTKADNMVMDIASKMSPAGLRFKIIHSDKYSVKFEYKVGGKPTQTRTWSRLQ